MVNKKQKEVKFTKEELLTSKNINYSKDAINAILDKDTLYSIDDANALIKKFMEGGK